MTARLRICTIAASTGIILLAGSTSAEVSWTLDASEWFSSTGAITTIDFTDLAEEQPPVQVTDQYADLGWTAPASSSFYLSSSNYVDGYGIENFLPDVEKRVDFASPINALGLDVLGTISVDFYLAGTLVESSPMFLPGEPGEVGFIGFETDFLFDHVVLQSLDNTVAIDNFHFPVIPAPAGFAFLALAGLTAGRRRNR